MCMWSNGKGTNVHASCTVGRTTSNHLINTAHFTWVKWAFANWLRIAKRMMLGFAILAFVAQRWKTSSKVVRNTNVFVNHALNGCIVDVAKANMPVVELPLCCSHVDIFIWCLPKRGFIHW